MEEERMSIEQIRALPKAAIAQKYGCSVQYVRKILQGKYNLTTLRSKQIVKDLEDILKILERDTNVEN
ncbi:hypothetical protein D0T53_05940 [Dysgonomonas sp. 216]|uniref:hypothetical protein n=1 Tax=Dysgonomonas sp. 216 TaxID=2302934 RepID=UPI0013D03BF9|nr:hypothetical protein [Dysgonomonas sp. 216]NDW18455.1 hypothetical protein [Dysgonomonas sp. 216]